MARYREKLPQLSGELFLTDAGLETDLIFNHGIEIREFAAHTLLPTLEGRAALASYFRGFLALANEMDAGFILDSQTWKAHRHWSGDLGETAEDLRRANHDALTALLHVTLRLEQLDLESFQLALVVLRRRALAVRRMLHLGDRARMAGGHGPSSRGGVSMRRSKTNSYSR